MLILRENYFCVHTLSRHIPPTFYHASTGYPVSASDPLIFETYNTNPLLFESYSIDPVRLHSRNANPLFFETYASDPLFFEPYSGFPMVNVIPVDQTSYPQVNKPK